MSVQEQVQETCEACGCVAEIGSIINEGLPDLIRMPTEPAKEFHKTSFGELMLKADGNIVASESIKLEKDGASYG